jgi:protein-tyrosine kinase
MKADPPAKKTKRRGSGIPLFRPGQAPGPTSDTPAIPADRAMMLPAIFANSAHIWNALDTVTLAQSVLTQNGLFFEASDHPAAAAFEILRAKLLHEVAEKQWHRIAVTSPGPGCGKSFVATNLALSLARRPSSRTALVDLDLRQPQIARILGLTDDCDMAGFLSGALHMERAFRRVGETLALGLNSQPVGRATDVLHDPNCNAALADIEELLNPEVILYDLPPILTGDEVLAIAPNLDAVLLVTDGTKTTAAEIHAAEKSLQGRIPVLGIVLNRAQEFHAGPSHSARK